MVRIRYVIAILMLVAAVQAEAVTIQPGTYRMEWRIPKADEAPFSDRMFGMLEPIPTEKLASIQGLVSDQPMWATDYTYVVVLDESQGTGKGYDVAYVATAPKGDQSVGLAAAVKIPLIKDETSGDLKGTLEPEIDVRLGDSETAITKKARLNLSVGFEHDEKGAPTLSHVNLIRLGGWYGTINTDEGVLNAMPVDLNKNGSYSDRGAAEVGGALGLLADDVVITAGDPAGVVPSYMRGDVKLIEGELYVVSVHPTGETIEIRPYEGETGTVSVIAKDSYGKPAVCTSLRAVSGLSEYEVAADRVKVPVGNYTCPRVTIKIGSGDQAFTLSSDKPLVVTSDSVTAIRLGGKPEIVIEPGNAAVSVRRGETLVVRMGITVGSTDMLDSDRNAVVNIRDPRGKLLLSGTSAWAWHDGGSHTCAFSIPANWKPGRYTIGASLDLSPYAKAVFDRIRLNVTR